MAPSGSPANDKPEGAGSYGESPAHPEVKGGAENKKGTGDPKDRPARL